MEVLQKVKTSINQLPFSLEVLEFEEGSTKTAEMAAKQLGVQVGQIAKSILFICKSQPVMVITCGDMKIKQGNLKRVAGAKPKLASFEECKEITGYEPGGLCPFDLKKDIIVLLDKSIDRFDKVYVAAGTANTAVPINMEQLLFVTGGKVEEICQEMVEDVG